MNIKMKIMWGIAILNVIIGISNTFFVSPNYQFAVNILMAILITFQLMLTSIILSGLKGES